MLNLNTEGQENICENIRPINTWSEELWVALRLFYFLDLYSIVGPLKVTAFSNKIIKGSEQHIGKISHFTGAFHSTHCSNFEHFKVRTLENNTK